MRSAAWSVVVVACCLVGCQFQSTCKVDGDCDFGYQCAPGQEDTVRECIKAGSSTSSSSSSGNTSTGGPGSSGNTSSVGASSTAGSSGSTSSGNVSMGSGSSVETSSGASSFGSSSALGSSSSTGSTSASLDVTDTGRVCDALFAGLQRSELWRLQDQYAGDCEPAFANEAEALASVAGHIQRGAECQVFPPGRLYTLALSLTSRGLLSRPGVEACINGGRAQLTFQGRLVVADGGAQTIEQLRDLYTATVMECLAGVTARTVDALDPDGGCRDILDCAPRDGGVACVRSPECSTQASARCQPLSDVGDPCGVWHPPCREPLVCLGGGGSGTCAAPAVLDDACGGASNLPCEGDLVCFQGFCKARRTTNETCEPGAPQCAPGLVCLENGRCNAPRQLGGSCIFPFDCASCLLCFTPFDDGGVRLTGSQCATPVGPGASCKGAPCHAGLFCVSPGVCAPPARLGETCALNFGLGEDGYDSHGNCAGGTACVPAGDGGTQRICVARATVGNACSMAPAAPGAVFPFPGSCAAGLTCARPSASVTSGTCVGPANFGQACCADGCTHASDRCVQSFGDPSVQCGQGPDGGSHCMPYPALQGMPCTQAGGCVGNQQCVNPDGGAASNGEWGRCDAPPGQGQPCDAYTELVFSGHACEASFYCSGTTNTCTARQGAGTPCTMNSQCQGYCADDGGCANARASGETCDDPAKCLDGTCYDGVCSNPACQPPPNVFDNDSLNLLDRILAWLFLG